ncbi:MAG: hypothetical protein ACYC2G_17235 [Gemmatimonadaceae bacterium]
MTHFAMPALGLAVLLAIPAYAQAPARAFVGTTVGEGAVTAHAGSAATMDRAQQHARAGNYRKAARAYHAAAEEQLRVGELPETALWQEASMYFAMEDNARAAASLDRLAGLAEDHGDPVAEARAMLHAALLYAQAGNADRALTLASDLRTLRNSPFIGDELRAEIDLRLGKP